MIYLWFSFLDEGDMTYQCEFCHALLWFNERAKKCQTRMIGKNFSICCLRGKVVLPKLREPPSAMKFLFFDKMSPYFKNFQDYIRQYNNMFSFTSMGGRINHSINNGRGPYTFCLSGINYHSIGDLLPPEGQTPVYSQLYIHDTSNEIDNRIAAVRYIVYLNLLTFL